MDKAERGVVSDVEEYGWSVMRVMEGDQGPGFAFTIGLYHTFKHPEILMIGLDIDFMSRILNNLGDDVKKGVYHEAGKQYSEVVETFLCSFQKIDEKFYRDYLGTAMWFYKGTSFPALQCVYPDMAGRYLWDPDVNPELVEMQPLLADAILSG
ncbi:MAG: DUF4262 domain-containing protein [Pyrinomonadaceae bacterium]|nr:DUF4262 domain-containing protein [Pyrinomonadaceae bacterium]